MSHFVVLVCGDNIEERLAPFNEQPEQDDPYVELTFHDAAELERETYETKTATHVRLPDGQLVLTWSDEANLWARTQFTPEQRAQIAKDNMLQLTEREVIRNILEKLPTEEVPFKQMYPDYNEYLTDWNSYELDEKTGKLGYWYNAKAKWDWYQVGGRWTGYFQAVDNSKYPDDVNLGSKSLLDDRTEQVRGADVIRKADVDIAKMQDEAAADARVTWQRYLDDTNKSAAEWIYGIKEGMTLEQYIEHRKKRVLVPFALLLEDGTWIERGSMGWWGVVTEENDNWPEIFEKLWNSLPDDTLITAVDCHI